MNVPTKQREFTAETPVRVAIIGGGCAGLTTAYQLTRPELKGQYEVTIYQYGHRLGGKGASSRGQNDRIEEHGIHVWMGCYENAFRMIRDVYGELERKGLAGRKRTWRDAFTPLPQVGLMHWEPQGGWEVWSTYFPPTPGVPGDPLEGHPLTPSGKGGNPFTVGGYLDRAFLGLLGLLEAMFASGGTRPTTAPNESQQWHEAGNPAQRLVRIVRGGTRALMSPTAILTAVRTLQVTVPNARRAALWVEALSLIDRAVTQILGQPAAMNGDVQRGMEVVDVMVASIRGVVIDGLLHDPRGFDAIDDIEYRTWLRGHGAGEAGLNSPLLRGLYNLMFAYREGDHRKPEVSAAVALRVCVRMFFTYRESFFYRMRAGMGDIVFTPLYRALEARGVRFEFFHRLTDLRLGETDGYDPVHHVQELEFNVQAKIRGGGEYQPLVDVRGLGCWPSEPLWEQLVDAHGVALEPQASKANFELNHDRWGVETKVLRAGEDFDLVVLAVGMAEIGHSCRELPLKIPRFEAMMEHVETVATQALQIWLEPDMASLGWDRGPIMATGFHHPFDSWNDMSPLLEEESFEPGESTPRPRTLAYFCNVFPDSAYPDGSLQQFEQATAAVRQNSIEFLDRQIGHLWPNAVDDEGHFRWSQLVRTGSMTRGAVAEGGSGAIDGQYYRANVNPSDRYILSVPGSSKYRVSPLEILVRNMTVAGDWTQCSINVGCIEAAVMSGKLAAHALTGTLPSLDEIVGYDHP